LPRKQTGETGHLVLEALQAEITLDGQLT